MAYEIGYEATLAEVQLWVKEKLLYHGLDYSRAGLIGYLGTSAAYTPEWRELYAFSWGAQSWGDIWEAVYAVWLATLGLVGIGRVIWAKVAAEFGDRILYLEENTYTTAEQVYSAWLNRLQNIYGIRFPTDTTLRERTAKMWAEVGLDALSILGLDKEFLFGALLSQAKEKIKEYAKEKIKEETENVEGIIFKAIKEKVDALEDELKTYIDEKIKEATSAEKLIEKGFIKDDIFLTEITREVARRTYKSSEVIFEHILKFAMFYAQEFLPLAASVGTLQASLSALRSRVNRSIDENGNIKEAALKYSIEQYNETVADSLFGFSKAEKVTEIEEAEIYLKPEQYDEFDKATVPKIKQLLGWEEIEISEFYRDTLKEITGK